MKKTKTEENIIDDINSRFWSNRYSNPEAIGKESVLVFERSYRAKYLKGMAYAKLNIAAASFLQSKNDKALENLSEALSWFLENSSEPGYAKALCLKGNIHESFGDYEKAMEYCYKSQKFAEINNDLETEAEVASQLGLIYTRLGNFPKALEYYNNGLRIRTELSDENAMASSLNRIGMLMRLTKRYDESLQFYARSLEIRTKNRQVTSIPWTLLGIAATYEELGNHPQALNHFEKGMVGSDRRCTLQCMMGTGRIYSLLGEGKKSEERLIESLKMAQELRALSLVSEAYSALANHYESTGQSAKALVNYKLYTKTRESVQSEEALSRFRNIEISHAIEKSEQEKEIYRLKHVELKAAFDIIEEKNKEIIASINSASRIQGAMLPDIQRIKDLESNIFILNLPKDIVSGDFCWFTQINTKLIIVAADCTDHGVPGAMMTMLGISFLEKIVNQMNITDSGLILDELRREIKKSLHQTGKREEAKNGMDISVCVIDKEQNSLQYSGAFNSLYIVRNHELIEFKADPMPIGYYEEIDKLFSKHDIHLVPGDIIYLFTDGYADQFGGPDHKKFKYPVFKSLLARISGQPLSIQKKRLEAEFIEWKGNNPQIDDVLIIGLRGSFNYQNTP